MKYLEFDKIEICRCERSGYNTFGHLHYLNGLGKGAICYKILIDGEDAVFASVLSMPIKGYTNCMIFHRLVIVEKYQNFGLSSLVLNLLGGIYLQQSKHLYAKTKLKKMGKMLKANPQWKPTHNNQKKRKLTKEDHQRNHARQRRAAFSYKYEGVCIEGFEDLTKPIQEIREQKLVNVPFKIDALKLFRQKYGLNNPEFFRDCIRNNFNFIRLHYEPLYGVSIQNEGLYSQEYEIRRQSLKNASQRYGLRLLYLNGIIFRLSHETSVEKLVYHLLLENIRQGFQLKNYDIIKLGLKVYNTDVNKYKDLKDKIESFKGYTVNKEYAKSQGLTVKQASNIARKDIRSRQIAKFYIPEKSDNENLEVLRINGLEISLSTLKRWRKEHGFIKYNKSVIPTI